MIRSLPGKTPKIAASAFVSEAAYVVGDVEIGENSTIWPGAVIRGDFAKITIGDNVMVEDNCVLHVGDPMVIGNYVNIAHGAVVHASKIGNHVLVGINATVLHEVEIGDYCIIGANSLVSQRMKIPDRSFVAGVPAEIKGKPTEEQMFWANTLPAIKLAQQYKEMEI